MYQQLSLFSYFQEFQKYNPIRDYAKHGSGFIDGKERIRKFFSENSNLNDRINYLKEEYGTGGFGFSTEKPCVVYNGYSNGRCCIIKYFNEDMQEIELKITYAELAKEIAEMILENEY